MIPERIGELLSSPFQGLGIDPNLACEFFGTFARFEYALKAAGYCRRGGFHEAKPNWQAFREGIGTALANYDDREVRDAVRFLIAAPPEAQMYENGRATFQPAALRGNNDGEKAIDAACRVRNNLFHGGKHTPPSRPGRDEKLIHCSLLILRACLELDFDLRIEFNDRP